MLVSLRIALISISVLNTLLTIREVKAQSASFHPIFKQDDAIRNTKSKDVLKYMNLTADPCYDFYEFSCGNWGKYNTPLKEHEISTPGSYLESKISNDLQNILEEQVTVQDGTTGRKVKVFYKSCLSAERNGQLQQVFFSDFIKGNGGFPAVPGSNWIVHHHNYNWQEVVGQLRYRYGMNILIGLEIDINYLNMDENSIYLGEPSTIIPPELCSADGTQTVDIREREYEPIENEVAEHLKTWLSLKASEAQKLAADIVTFEFELCTAMKVNIKSDNYSSFYPNYPRKPLTNFSHQFNNSIDFNQFVTTSFGTPIYKPVFMTSESYFQQLIKTVHEHNKTTVANYIMYRALAMLSLPPDDQHNKRPNYCLNILKRYFPKVIGEMYHRKYASTSAKNDINIIFDKLKHSFHKSLRSQWIEESTSRVGTKKLSKILLDFPKYEKTPLNNLKMEPTNYWHNLAHVMAQVQQHQLSRIFATDLPQQPNDEMEAYETRLQYRPTHKRIDMSWGLMQEPYYEQLYPNSMRYAMTGQRIARELASAFDDLSWTSDILGLFNWDLLTEQEYKNRTECFRRQISNYLSNSPNTFQNFTKLRELIAASAGLNVAFNAYLNWLDFLNPSNDFAILSKETLPDLNFTNTQLFFITYAQMHCRAEKKAKPAPTFSPLVRQTIDRYEVNGPLWNFAEFAREFSCAAGAGMNPDDKCIIY